MTVPSRTEETPCSIFPRDSGEKSRLKTPSWTKHNTHKTHGKERSAKSRRRPRAVFHRLPVSGSLTVTAFLCIFSVTTQLALSPSPHQQTPTFTARGLFLSRPSDSTPDHAHHHPFPRRETSRHRLVWSTTAVPAVRVLLFSVLAGQMRFAFPKSQLLLLVGVAFAAGLLGGALAQSECTTSSDEDFDYEVSFLFVCGRSVMVWFMVV